MTRTDLIKRAIESARCRQYKVRARDSYSVDHQQKAENQTEIMDITIEALEKQIPKRVIRKLGGTENCPCCDFDNSSFGYGVCIDCGQKLDWSDEEFQ